jgi:pimeloyl-ACP methyl ester carboxylesterase/class 3 adenylate cyclase
LLVSALVGTLRDERVVTGTISMSPSAANPEGAEVFISYAQDEDGARALELADHLEAAGLTVWLADRSIEGAQNYGPEVVSAIEQCDVVVVLCSAASLGSEHVAVEVELAFEASRPRLPLRLDDTAFPGRIRYWLTGSNWIDISGPTSQWLPSVIRALERLGVSGAVTTDARDPLGDRPGSRAPAVGPADIRYAKSGEVNIAYQMLGTGPPDVLAFSSATLPIDSMNDEPSLVRFNHRLASFSRLMRFDLRGIGMSDPVPVSSPPTLEQWVEDAIAVMDAAGSEQVAIFAPRDASLHGILLATTVPDRVTGLVIVNGTARYAKADDYPIGIPQDLLDGFLTLHAEADAVERGLDFLALEAPSVASDERFRAWWNRAGNRGASPATSRAIQAVWLRADVRSLLPLVRVPTLILHRQDVRLLRVDHGRYLAEHIPGSRYVELPGSDDLYWIGDTDAMLDEVEEFLTGVRDHPSSDQVLATVAVIAIVEPRKPVAETGDGRRRDLHERYRRMVSRHLDQLRGHEFRTTDEDVVLASFDSPARAVACATGIRDAASRLGLAIRAGIHTGEVVIRGEQMTGLAVDVATRARELAEPQQVLASRTTVDLIGGSGVETIDRGEHSLDGIPGSWRLLSVED